MKHIILFFNINIILLINYFCTNICKLIILTIIKIKNYK